MREDWLSIPLYIRARVYRRESTDPRFDWALHAVVHYFVSRYNSDPSRLP